MPSPNATPTPITPPRVPLIDPRTGLIDRAWYLFFLSLLNAATTIDNGDVGIDAISLIASYDAALQALAQEVETQPPPVDLSAELIKQIEAAGLIDCCSGLLSQIAEIQKQIDALNASPNLRPPSVADVSGLGTMAVQNADNVAITGGTINNTTIGATTPSTGVFTTLTGGGGSANFFQTQGAATTKAVEVKALGSDTNIAFVIDSKGTGAIDLAAGSSGVNISNGGTVTAITPTAAGSGYTSVPSCAISAPTTAGGVQATGGPNMGLSTVTIASGGSGYTVGDVLTLSGGTGTAATVTVATLSGSAVATVTITTLGAYTVLPTNPVTLTGGTGSGATLTVNTYAIRTNTFNITNAGSGYVEQPTVTFSGGGGSGAAAYATVGSNTTLRGLGNAMDFYTSSANIAMRVYDAGGNGTGYWRFPAGFSATATQISSSAGGNIAAGGTGLLSFQTSNTVTQMTVAHTASAVNFVQMTGSATGAGASALGGVLFTGSDTNVNGAITTKGVGYIAFAGGGSTSNQAFRVLTTSAVSTGNLIAVQGAAAGSAPSIQAISGTSGSDANIDLTLTPKGTGLVRFGTRTASADAPVTGYLEIKDSGGTIRRLAIIG